MEKFGKSQSVTRREDQRFLTGAGRYVDDITPQNALFAFFLRSPVAHAEIAELDVSDAADMDGVQLIVTAQDLDAAGFSNHIPTTLVTNIDGTKGADPVRPKLATTRVRFVGEAIHGGFRRTAHPCGASDRGAGYPSRSPEQSGV